MTWGRKASVVRVPAMKPSAVIVNAIFLFVQALHKRYHSRMVSAENTVGRALTELHQLGGRASRNELTERLGCGRSVMGYVLGELVERGLVEIDRSVSLAPGRQGGRPSHGVVIGED